MIPNMRRLLEQLQTERPNEPQTAKVMRVFECKKSIATACKKLGIPRFTHHDLRHLFATRCIESGVDIPTVSRWLGHRDGGALAMKVYGHLRDQHSTNMAQKVVFAEAATNLIALPLPHAPTENATDSVDKAHHKEAIAQAKAKYSYPWWVSKNPVEVFWGQLNEVVQIVPAAKYLECAKQAMNREVFAEELADPQSLREEFIARTPKAILAEIKTRLAAKEPETLSKAS
jgi:hypothetical protein